MQITTSGQERILKVVGKNSETVILEEGYWMKRSDYDFINRPDNVGRTGLDINKDNKQLTWFFIPIF